MQTGELDGVAWSGITEDDTVGWANLTDLSFNGRVGQATP